MTSNKVGVSVKRGPESWAFIYVTLGFALSIEGTIIGMIAPLLFPWNLAVYAVVGVTTFWMFVDNGWFQNKLIQMKLRYEGKER